ncbi:MAG: hypothetical protein IT379_37340 [Deltaproteobacteria bacterium]|nr:hypothetical protein [Deltaproteobacteria bacterium]
MSAHEDEDGIDGPWERAMRRAIREDERRIQFPACRLYALEVEQRDGSWLVAAMGESRPDMHTILDLDDAGPRMRIVEVRGTVNMVRVAVVHERRPVIPKDPRQADLFPGEAP